MLEQILSDIEIQNRLIAAAVTTILTALLKYIFSPKSRVKWGTSHVFTFSVQQQAGGVDLYHTGTIFVQNLGRAPAQGVEVHLNFEPQHLQVWPTTSYETEKLREGYFVVRARDLGPREWFTIEMLSRFDLPAVLRVRTPQGECPQVPMAPMQIFPAWVRRTYLLLALLGVFAIVQNVLWLVR